MASLLATGITKFLGSVAAATKGWGQGQIHWASTLNEGKARAAREGKPLMVVVHKDRCPACTHLGKRFSQSQDLLKLSNHFVMVQTDAYEDAPDEKGFHPDGGYVPRILFYEPSGAPLPNVRANPRPPQMYAYTGESSILKSMQQVVDMFPRK